jgi:hypothetical protein
LGKPAFLQKKDDGAFGLGCNGERHVGQTFAKPGRRKIDIAFRNRGASLTGLQDELEKRAAEGDEVRELLPQERP